MLTRRFITGSQKNHCGASDFEIRNVTFFVRPADHHILRLSVSLEFWGSQGSSASWGFMTRHLQNKGKKSNETVLQEWFRSSRNGIFFAFCETTYVVYGNTKLTKNHKLFHETVVGSRVSPVVILGLIYSAGEFPFGISQCISPWETRRKKKQETTQTMFLFF